MKEDLESFGWVYTDLFRCNGEMMGEGFGPMDESTETSRESPEPSREKGPARTHSSLAKFSTHNCMRTHPFIGAHMGIHTDRVWQVLVEKGWACRNQA